MSENLISIIMPVKNADKYIRDSIQSILSQTYGNFEFIIIDDGSTDSTAEIVDSFSDERIRFYKRESLGIIEQLNFGLSEAKGEFIARMDGDDIANPEKLGLQLNFLLCNKDIHLAGTNFSFISESGKLLMNKKLPEKHNDIEFMMPFIDSILHSSILTYKNVLLDSGGYNTEYSYAEDDELFLRLLSLGYKMHNIQKNLYKYRLVERPDEHFEMQKINYYKCGVKYLENHYAEKNGEYYLRMGLLEYYRGSIKKSREQILKSLRFKNIKKKYFFRYLPVAFLGDKVVNFLRRKRITSKINSCINKNFNIDSYNISGSDIKK
jgi:glycosyltransferase involved in cell wall biosynthesis